MNDETRQMLEELREHNSLPPIAPDEFTRGEYADTQSFSVSTGSRWLLRFEKHGWVSSRYVMRGSQACVAYKILDPKAVAAFMQEFQRGLAIKNARKGS